MGRNIKLFELLKDAKCPNEDCDGNGTIVGVDQRCCGIPEGYECCGQPVLDVYPIQCQWCSEREEALSLLLPFESIEQTSN